MTQLEINAYLDQSIRSTIELYLNGTTFENPTLPIEVVDEDEAEYLTIKCYQAELQRQLEACLVTRSEILAIDNEASDWYLTDVWQPLPRKFNAELFNEAAWAYFGFEGSNEEIDMSELPEPPQKESIDWFKATGYMAGIDPITSHEGSSLGIKEDGVTVSQALEGSPSSPGMSSAGLAIFNFGAKGLNPDRRAVIQADEMIDWDLEDILTIHSESFYVLNINGFPVRVSGEQCFRLLSAQREFMERVNDVVSESFSHD